LVKEQVKAILNEKIALIKALKDVKFVSKIYPSDDNFVLIKVDNATKRYFQLIEKGIVDRNRTNQPLCENCLRFTVGTPEENKKLIKVLKEIL
jgi:histidinol-phosphate aminotransferase